MTKKTELTLIRPDLLVDSRTIAERLDNQHENVIGLIQTHLAHFESFGVLRFETGKPSEGSLGGRPPKYALLNEDQCYFLLSLSRNNQTVVALKAGLVRAFRQAREAAYPALNMTDPLVLAQQFVQAETQRRVLSAENVELRQVLVVAAPKVESFDAYIGTEGLHNCNTAAKLVGWGRNKMFEELRRRKILMSGGDSQNVPYQRFIDEGYFKVKVQSWRSPAGEGVDTTTFVTSRGIEYLHRLIGKTGRPQAANPPRPIQRGQLSKRESALLFAHQLQDQE